HSTSATSISESVCPSRKRQRRTSRRPSLTLPALRRRRLRLIPQAVILAAMSDVTRILSAIAQGDPHAAEQLLPLVYEELRQLAAQKLAREKPGQTLQA